MLPTTAGSRSWRKLKNSPFFSCRSHIFIQIMQNFTNLQIWAVIFPSAVIKWQTEVGWREGVIMSNLCRETSKNYILYFKETQYLHIFTLESLINVCELTVPSDAADGGKSVCQRRATYWSEAVKQLYGSLHIFCWCVTDSGLRVNGNQIHQTLGF